MSDKIAKSWVWVFMGSKALHPSAVFESQSDTESWIVENKLTGTLTKYPVNVTVYDCVIANGYWKPSQPWHGTPKHIGNFFSAYMEHYHFFDGSDGPPPPDHDDSAD